MVIHYLHIVGIPVAPDKADAPLLVDANAMLPFSLAVERLQAVAWRRCQVAQLCGNVQLSQLALRHPLECPKPFDPLPGTWDPLC